MLLKYEMIHFVDMCTTAHHTFAFNSILARCEFRFSFHMACFSVLCWRLFLLFFFLDFLCSASIINSFFLFLCCFCLYLFPCLLFMCEFFEVVGSIGESKDRMVCMWLNYVCQAPLFVCVFYVWLAAIFE